MAISLAIEAAINAKWGGLDSHNQAAQTAGVAFIIVSYSCPRLPRRHMQMLISIRP